MACWKNTLVIITSDHGEEFGEHGVFDHGYSLYLDEVHVPLVILAATAPAGRVVAEPVSLRDLPATVVDLLGLAADSPFPGRSLAAHWRVPPGAPAPHDPGDLGGGLPDHRAGPAARPRAVPAGLYHVAGGQRLALPPRRHGCRGAV